jgi:hypothetical protein
MSLYLGLEEGDLGLGLGLGLGNLGLGMSQPDLGCLEAWRDSLGRLGQSTLVLSARDTLGSVLGSTESRGCGESHVLATIITVRIHSFA